MTMDPWYNMVPVVRSGDFINILEVNEYLNEESICTQDSYYRCLAKRFVNLVSRNNENKTFSCHLNQTCLPFSLPLGEINIPLCEDSTATSCSKEILRRLQEDQDKHCLKSCHVKEYKTKVIRGYG